MTVFNTGNPNDPGTELDFGIGYGDLAYNISDLWIKTGGSDTGGDSGHGTTDYNRYMTQAAGSGLYNATVEYLNSHPGVAQVCVNDMALGAGGKFDICNAPYPSCRVVKPWDTPHISHDRGTAADVSGPGAAQCPVANQIVIADFLQACIDNQANAMHSVNEGNQAHCNWADPATYPH